MQTPGFLSGLGNRHPWFSSKGICKQQLRNTSQVKYRGPHFHWQLLRESVYPKKSGNSCKGQCPQLVPGQSSSLCLEMTSPPSCLLLPPGAKSLQQALVKDASAKRLWIPNYGIKGKSGIL